MKLKKLINEIKGSAFARFKDFEVRGISCNSKAVQNDFVFVAINGNNADGHVFIKEALAKGARALLVERLELPKEARAANVCVVKVKDTRKAAGLLAAAFYGFPSASLKTVGVTGTNGKTTITYAIEAILKEAGYFPAVIGTVNYRFGSTVEPSKNTTPGPVELQALLARMRESGVEYVAMEVSSHALDQGRTEGIDFHSAIFTNLTQDHLDYHRDVKQYFLAKSKLFTCLKKEAFAIVNTDDPYGKKLKSLTRAEVITYGIAQKADVMANGIKLGVGGSAFFLKTARIKIPMRTQLIGEHNVYNLLATSAWAMRAGIDVSVIQAALEKLQVVPGRLEKVSGNGGFSVFVDYAHTEDALANVLTALRQFARRRIVVVFGCGGGRDKTKRPKMGRVVSELADYAIITSDNPRREDPGDIIAEIKKGIRKDNYCVVVERMEAIRKSLSLAKPGDIVLIAGKGHEEYQIFKDRTIHFDDREAVRQCLL